MLLLLGPLLISEQHLSELGNATSSLRKETYKGREEQAEVRRALNRLSRDATGENFIGSFVTRAS